MTTQSELEKTQLEIARLQLEQERRKLAKLEQRDVAVRGVGSAVTGAGRAAGSVLGWLMATTLGAVIGGIGGWAIMAFFAFINSSPQCKFAPETEFLFTVGCVLGAHHWLLVVGAAIGVLTGLRVGHGVWSGSGR